ncbi:hypothetical protein K438DRAFT_1777377 [Mycena galopus ATCC 62051]|nr:hypothetical protein K438DRAFT_1777377 [Mycena galopus ATCC 62051]
MTTSRPTTATNASTATELESLVALVARLSVVSMDAVRLAAEVQARLPAVVAAEVVHARASATAAAATAAADATAAATAVIAASSVLWSRGVPYTPAELEARYPQGSGETCAEADAVCNGVPNQVKAKKTSRREPLPGTARSTAGPQRRRRAKMDGGVIQDEYSTWGKRRRDAIIPDATYNRLDLASGAQETGCSYGLKRASPTEASHVHAWLGDCSLSKNMLKLRTQRTYSGETSSTSSTSARDSEVLSIHLSMRTTMCWVTYR